MPAIEANKACAVQIFEVAFSRFYMLFAGLQSHAQGGFPVGIFAYAYNPSGHIAFEFIARSKISCSRTAKVHGYSPALGRAESNIGAPFARRS